MKLLATSLLALLCHSEAFTPIPKSFVVSYVGSGAFSVESTTPVRCCGTHTNLSRAALPHTVPRFTSLGMADLNELSLEEEVELLTQEEITKVKRASNLRNANGVDYAPWMGISEEDENRIKQMMKERASARRKRQEQEKDVSGALFSDSQAQELSGTGLKTKVIDGAVELEWATNSEKDTKGFLVKRRPTKTSEFQIVGSYKDWGPLQSKGPEGGVYRFLDTSAAPGSWVYRISEVDLDGKENDVCQCLVDVQTEEEQRGAVIAAVGISVVAILSVIAGVLLDPMDGF